MRLVSGEGEFRRRHQQARLLAPSTRRHAARVAELVDAMDSKSISRKGVGVRVPSLVPPLPRTAAVRALADELGIAILPAIQEFLRRSTKAFDAVSARSEKGVLADERAMADIERRREESDDVGWCLGVIAAGSGTDLLRARRERRGLAPIVTYVGLALGGRPVLPDPSELPLLARGAGRGWEVPFLVGAFFLRVCARADASTPIRWRFESSDQGSVLQVLGRAPRFAADALALVPEARTPACAASRGEEAWQRLVLPPGWIAS